MKRYFVSLFTIVLFCSMGGNAQALRYQSEVFSSYQLQSNIQYGTTTTQKLDIYTGTGDHATNRPLVVFIHGAGHGTTNTTQHYSYTDNTALSGSMQDRLKQVDLDGTTYFTEPIEIGSPTSVKETAPIEFALKQNYPNPFNPSTEIKFSVEKTEHATLTVYNMLGQQVALLFDGMAEAGQYDKVRFEGTALASGIYFYRLQTEKKSDLKKLILLK